MPAVRHRRLAGAGVTLHVAEAGPEDGPVVVLLHGFPECWAGWWHQIDALAALGYRVVVPDQRGYHTSDRPTAVHAYRIELLGADILALLDGLGVEQADVVGHDWGGAVAWWLALEHPERVRRLAVLNMPHPRVLTRALRRPRQLLKSWYMLVFQVPGLAERMLNAQNQKKLIGSLYAHSVRRDFSPEQLGVYRAAWSQPGAIRSMLAWYRAAARHPPDRTRHDSYEGPALMIWGRQDQALGYELVGPSMVHLPNGRLHVIEDAAHFVQHDAPDRVNDRLGRFLGPASKLARTMALPGAATAAR